MWFNKKENKGLFGILDSTVNFMEKLHRLGGIAYILFGVGLFLLIALIVFTGKVTAVLGNIAIPLIITLIASATVLMIVWQMLEYKVSTRKLEMIINITEKMVEKKLSTQGHLDTTEIKSITEEIVKNIWGLEISLTPKNTKSA